MNEWQWQRVDSIGFSVTNYLYSSCEWSKCLIKYLIHAVNVFSAWYSLSFQNKFLVNCATLHEFEHILTNKYLSRLLPLLWQVIHVLLTYVWNKEGRWYGAQTDNHSHHYEAEFKSDTLKDKKKDALLMIKEPFQLLFPLLIVIGNTIISQRQRPLHTFIKAPPISAPRV